LPESRQEAGIKHLRFTNTAILIAIGVLTLSGVYGIFWTLNGWLFEVHRGAAWALVAAFCLGEIQIAPRNVTD
jgi:membrane protein required for beta-lactamase induction